MLQDFKAVAQIMRRTCLKRTTILHHRFDAQRCDGPGETLGGDFSRP